MHSPCLLKSHSRGRLLLAAAGEGGFGMRPMVRILARTGRKGGEKVAQMAENSTALCNRGNTGSGNAGSMGVHMVSRVQDPMLSLVYPSPKNWEGGCSGLKTSKCNFNITIQ